MSAGFYPVLVFLHQQTTERIVFFLNLTEGNSQSSSARKSA